MSSKWAVGDGKFATNARELLRGTFDCQERIKPGQINGNKCEYKPVNNTSFIPLFVHFVECVTVQFAVVTGRSVIPVWITLSAVRYQHHFLLIW